MEVAAATDIGMRRANNQDSHAVVLAEEQTGWQARGHLFVVADGMGAHAAGELASQLAVEGIPHLYHHYRDLAPAAALERSISETNAEIHRRGQANPDFHAMGTTASFYSIQRPFEAIRENGGLVVEINPCDTDLTPLATHKVRMRASEGLKAMNARQTVL